MKISFTFEMSENLHEKIWFRNNLWFYSERTKRHAIAGEKMNFLWFQSKSSQLWQCSKLDFHLKKISNLGCLLVLGFFLPLSSRRLIDPYLAISCALFYAFLVVPVVSGLVNANPVFNFFRQLMEWDIFNSLYTKIVQ